jgi:hypothetical protein
MSYGTRNEIKHKTLKKKKSYGDNGWVSNNLIIENERRHVRGP